jgi:hypothetical protein
MFKSVAPRAARLILAATLLCVPVAALTAAAPVAAATPAAAQTYCQTKTASYYQGVVMTGNLMATITGTACWSPGLNGGVWGSSMKLWTQYSAIGSVSQTHSYYNNLSSQVTFWANIVFYSGLPFGLFNQELLPRMTYSLGGRWGCYNAGGYQAPLYTQCFIS